jgi:hypothetical protein
MTQHGQHQRVYIEKGLPVNITVDDKGKQSQAMVFWAVRYNDKEVNIPC